MAEVSEHGEHWMGKDPRVFAGLRTRIIGSIVGGTAWLVFILLYVGFWATGFTLGQSIVVVLVSIVLLVGALGVLWVSWGMRFGMRQMH
jgi:hypothetical protein